MWRRNGKLVSYVYCDDKEKGCGDDWPWRFKAQPGKWTTICVYMKLNDLGAPHLYRDFEAERSPECCFSAGQSVIHIFLLAEQPQCGISSFSLHIASCQLHVGCEEGLHPA